MSPLSTRDPLAILHDMERRPLGPPDLGIAQQPVAELLAQRIAVCRRILPGDPGAGEEFGDPFTVRAFPLVVLKMLEPALKPPFASRRTIASAVLAAVALLAKVAPPAMFAAVTPPTVATVVAPCVPVTPA